MNYLEIYNQKSLEKDALANCNRTYQQCSVSVMDTIADPNITFDQEGRSNYYHYYQEGAVTNVLSKEAAQKAMAAMVAEIKQRSKGKKYDCILGLSGGADSSYMAYLAKDLGLNPLLVHFDYGWNLETAVQNIERIVKYTGFDLYTYVIDWVVFKDLLKSYIKASVLDLDVPADHLIFASLVKVAKKEGISSLLKGYNFTSESILPKTWNYNQKFDLKNMTSIHKKYGTVSLSKVPKLGFFRTVYYDKVVKLKDFTPLNFISYNVREAKKEMNEKMGWVDYGGKHCENIFTRFYQAYILPKKFNIDKRKAHLSSLIFSGQITKVAAIEELSAPAYPIDEINNDLEYIAKKLDWTTDELLGYLHAPPVSHNEFGSEQKLRDTYLYFAKKFQALKGKR